MSLRVAAKKLAQTAISSIDPDEGVLMYRGYDIGELAKQSTYEEVAYLHVPRSRLEALTHEEGRDGRGPLQTITSPGAV